MKIGIVRHHDRRPESVMLADEHRGSIRIPMDEWPSFVEKILKIQTDLTTEQLERDLETYPKLPKLP